MVAEVTKQSQIETQPPMSTKSTLPPSHSHPQVGRQQQLHATHSNTANAIIGTPFEMTNSDMGPDRQQSLPNGKHPSPEKSSGEISEGGVDSCNNSVEHIDKVIIHKKRKRRPSE